MVKQGENFLGRQVFWHYRQYIYKKPNLGHDLVGSGWGVDNGMWRSIIETLGLGVRASTRIVNNDKISLGQVIHMEIYLPLPKGRHSDNYCYIKWPRTFPYKKIGPQFVLLTRVYKWLRLVLSTILQHEGVWVKRTEERTWYFVLENWTIEKEGKRQFSEISHARRWSTANQAEIYLISLFMLDLMRDISDSCLTEVQFLTP